MTQKVCAVYTGSSVDGWAGHDITGLQCGEVAAYVVRERDTDSVVCARHKEVWATHRPNLKIIRDLTPPVSDEDVAEAIRSIQAAIQKT